MRTHTTIGPWQQVEVRDEAGHLTALIQFDQGWTWQVLPTPDTPAGHGTGYGSAWAALEAAGRWVEAYADNPGVGA